MFLLHQEHDFFNFCCNPCNINFCIEEVSVGEIYNTRLDTNEGHSNVGVQQRWCLAGIWWSPRTSCTYIPQSPNRVKVLARAGIEHEDHIESVYRSHYGRNFLMCVSGAWKDLETSQLRWYVDRDWSVNSVIRSCICSLNKAKTPWIQPTSPDLNTIYEPRQNFENAGASWRAWLECNGGIKVELLTCRLWAWRGSYHTRLSSSLYKPIFFSGLILSRLLI